MGAKMKTQLISNIAASMWTKTLLAVIWGLLITTSLLFNLNNTHWLDPDAMLLLGTLLSFVLWVSVMVYCLCSQHLWQASKTCFASLFLSVLINLGQIYV